MTLWRIFRNKQPVFFDVMDFCRLIFLQKSQFDNDGDKLVDIIKSYARSVLRLFAYSSKLLPQLHARSNRQNMNDFGQTGPPSDLVNRNGTIAAICETENAS